MAKKIYKEKQNFLSLNLKLALGGLSLMAIGTVVKQYLNPNYSLHTVDLISGIAVGVLLVAFVWFVLKLSIKTAITPKGIEFKMAPFHHRKRVLHWSEIKSIHMVSIPRFSSWQTSYNNYMLQKKFTFSGRNGISIETCDGEQYFIGSSNVKKLHKAIKKARDKYDFFVCED